MNHKISLQVGEFCVHDKSPNYFSWEQDNKSSQLQLLFHQPYFYISCLVLLPCISTWLCRDTTEPAKNPEEEEKMCDVRRSWYKSLFF